MTDKLIPFNNMWWLIPENSYGAKWCKKFQTAAVFPVLNTAHNQRGWGTEEGKKVCSGGKAE